MISIQKCSECGNTFQIDIYNIGELLSCPSCSSYYEVVSESGQLKLKLFEFGEIRPRKVGRIVT